jgi:hypothetical protein
MTKTTDIETVKVLQWVTKPEGAEVYDEAFWVRKQRWGTFVSVGADDRDIITALTEEQCIAMTRGYLKQRQEGLPEYTRSYDSFVGGKL